MSTVTLRNGDCVEVMRTLADGSVGAVVCDPPYGLRFMGKAFDDLGDGAAQREWHLGWITEAYRVLRPGGVIKAFGGTRTFHHLGAVMRETGFTGLRLEAWNYGSGFPKSMSVDKAMDRSNGDPGRIRKFTAWMRTTGVKARLLDQVLRDAGLISPNSNFSVHFFNDNQPVTPSKAMWDVVRPLLGDIPPWVDEIVHRIEAERIKVGEREGTGLAVAPGQGLERSSRTLDITVSSTIVARAWEGWGTALKPAWEPVLVGRKTE